MTTLVTVTVGTGKQYATLAAFATFINTQNLINLDQTYVVNVYEDQTVTGKSFIPINTDNTHTVIIQPAPGLGVNDLDTTGALAYGTSGVQLICNTSSAMFIGSGVAFRGFRFLVTGSSSTDTTAIYMSKYGQVNGNSVVQDIQYCRFSINSLSHTIMDGNNNGNGRIMDNIFIYNNAASTSQVYLSSLNGTFVRNTVVGTNGGNSPIGTYNNSVIKDNVFLKCGAKSCTGPEQGRLNGTTFANNFSDSTADSSFAGFTVNTGTNALVQNAPTDLRPTAAGPLINAASASAQATFDIRGQYRGTVPDVGASQYAAQALPLPTGTVTSQSITAENFSISGTTANNPTSGTITFTPTSGGAAYGPNPLVLGSGTFSYSLANMTPGTYAAPVISLTSTSGSGSVTGSTGFTSSAPVAPTVTITSEVVNYQTITISGTTAGIPTSGTIALPVGSTPNGAVAVAPTAVTLGTNTFTVTFTNVTPGNYGVPIVSFANGVGTTTTSTGGTTFTINPVVVPTMTITSQVVTNQSLTISGTTTGNPTSGTIALPIGSTPNGAVAVSPTSVTLGADTFTVTFNSVTPGNYGVPVVAFSNSAGTTTVDNGGTTFTIPPLPSFPSVTITNQVVTNQTLVVTGTTTGVPSSGLMSLAVGTTPNGAVAVSSASTFVTVINGTFTAIAYGITPGNYAAPTVTVSNTFGTSTAATGGTTFTVNPVAVGGNTIKTIGTGKDFATIKTFATWLQAKSLVADNENVTAYVYENQPFAATANTSLTPLTSSATNTCTIKPAPGLGVNDLDTTGAVWFPSSGIMLQLRVYASLISGPFVKMSGFLIDVVYDGTAANSYDYGLVLQGTLQYNRIRSNANAPAVIAGSGGNVTNVADNFFLQTGGTGSAILNGWSGTTQRNTFVLTGSATGTLFANNSYSLGYLYNNVFVNGGGTPITGSTLQGSSNNYTDTSLTTAISGVIYAGNLITNPTSDIRPTAAGPLIASASSTAISTNDLRGNNRGATPDVGAVQLNAAPALPTGTITSQTLNGQILTISGTTTNVPTSGSISIAVGSPANGAVAIGSTALTLGSGTFTVTISGISPGNYSTPSITLTNTGGTGIVTGASSFVINGISGNPIAPAVVPSAPIVTITSQVVTSQSITISGNVTGSPTSGTIALAVGSPPNGAVAVAPVAVNLGNSTFSVTINGITPGNYAIPVVSFVNGIGTTTTSTGGTTFTIATQAASAPIVTVSSVTLNAAVATSSGTVNLEGDVAGSLNIYFNNQNNASVLGPFIPTISNGTWNLTNSLTDGVWLLQATALANTYTTTVFNGSNVTVMSASGTPSFQSIFSL